MQYSKKTTIWLKAAALLYCCLAAFHWMGDPLAMAPQLDAGENLELAALIHREALPATPFYRAMLYPWIISQIPAPGAWPIIVVVFGLFLHITSALLAGRIARTVWKSETAEDTAFILQALNPVSLFFALQGMDMALGIALFLGALHISLGDKRKWGMFAAGTLAGAACLARPHFVPAALLLPLIPILVNWKPGRAAFTRTGLVALGLALSLSVQGFINLSHSGEFRILPWQGAYNLYAANREGANGLYYKQSIDVSGGQYSNPARAESELIYAAETGESPPFEINEMNRHWRNRFLADIGADPMRWIKLNLFKAYAVLNNVEQYNNLTYSYHKARLPLLRFNPLCWGILLISGGLGFMLLYRTRRPLSWVILAVILGYSVSLILYYASARFRLPLVPLLAILSGGLAAHARLLIADRGRIILTAMLVALTAGLTFSQAGQINNKDTYIQDRLLLANANAEINHDPQAARLAGEVLREQPDRQEAQKIYTISYFNMQLEQSPALDEFNGWEEQRHIVRRIQSPDPAYESVYAFYLWNWGQPNMARDIWSRHQQESALAATALKAIQQLNESTSSNNPVIHLLQ